MLPSNELKQSSFFVGLTDAELEKLSAIAEEKTFEAGTQMYKIGDAATYLHVLKEGKVILTMDSYMGPHKPPLQVTLDIITKDDSMGWSAVVEPYIYTLGALCIDRATVIMLDAVKLRELMESDCTLGYKIMQQVAKMIANRLNHTRIILVGERGLSHLTEY